MGGAQPGAGVEQGVGWALTKRWSWACGGARAHPTHPLHPAWRRAPPCPTRRTRSGCTLLRLLGSMPALQPHAPAHLAQVVQLHLELPPDKLLHILQLKGWQGVGRRRGEEACMCVPVAASPAPAPPCPGAAGKRGVRGGGLHTRRRREQQRQQQHQQRRQGHTSIVCPCCPLSSALPPAPSHSHPSRSCPCTQHPDPASP